MASTDTKARTKRPARRDGDCFPVALHLVMNATDAMLCHGVATLTVPPYGRFVHAWVEWCGLVFDHSNGRKVAIQPNAYYAIGNINPATVRRYTEHEARRLAIESGHYGPWAAELIAVPDINEQGD